MNCESLPQVALPFMNTVHCEELNLVNRLEALLAEENISKPEISACLEEWVSHTEAHFARENRLMEEYSFPPYGIHRNEHDRVFQQLLDVQENWNKTANIKNLNQYVQKTWPAWFEQHLMTMDAATANFLSQFKIEIEL